MNENATTEGGSSAPAPARKKYVRAVGPRLRILLYAIFALMAALGANSVYLASITFLGWLKRSSGQTFENYFYMYMFLAHLVLGLLLVLPVIIFGGILGGVFTPTEAAVVAVIYAIIVGMAIYREISFAYLNFDNATMYPLIVLILLASVVINAFLSRWERRLLVRRGMR